MTPYYDLINPGQPLQCGERITDYLLEIKSYIVLRYNTWLNSLGGIVHSTSKYHLFKYRGVAQGEVSPVNDQLGQSNETTELATKSEELTRSMQGLLLNSEVEVPRDCTLGQNIGRITPETHLGGVFNKKMGTLLDILLDVSRSNSLQTGFWGRPSK